MPDLLLLAPFFDPALAEAAVPGLRLPDAAAVLGVTTVAGSAFGAGGPSAAAPELELAFLSASECCISGIGMRTVVMPLQASAALPF